MTPIAGPVAPAAQNKKIPGGKAGDSAKKYRLVGNDAAERAGNRTDRAADGTREVAEPAQTIVLAGMRPGAIVIAGSAAARNIKLINRKFVVQVGHSHFPICTLWRDHSRQP
jgi:hypothetical protein